MADVIRTIALDGFDPGGEPSIQVMSDGCLVVRFEFMPPSDVPDEDGLGPFEEFDREMSEAAGAPVVWEDRELFRVSDPAADTLERVRAFVEGYRRRG